MREDLPGLRALLTVARKRSFTAAAAELRVSPSAISQSVRTLEDRVGVRLVARTTRSVGLTEAGAQFVERIAAAIEADGLTCQVSIDEALTDVVAERFDAGLRLGHTLDREMIAVRVSPDQRLVVVGSPAYFARKGKPTHPRDLHEHACINLRMATKGTVGRWRFVDEGKELEIAVHGNVVTDDGALLVDAALDGLGLAYVFESMARPHLAEKRLVRVLDRYCPQIPGYFLYYPSRANIAPKLKALVDFLARATPRRPRAERER